MGEESVQGIIDITKYLDDPAEDGPEPFTQEWEKRISAWLSQIQNDPDGFTKPAKLVREERKTVINPLFERVDIALEALMRSGKEAYIKYGNENRRIFFSEFDRQFNISADNHFYWLNNFRRFIHM